MKSQKCLTNTRTPKNHPTRSDIEVNSLPLFSVFTFTQQVKHNSAQQMKGKSRHKSIALKRHLNLFTPHTHLLETVLKLEKGNGTAQLTGVLHGFDLACTLPCLLLLCLTGHQTSDCHFHFYLCPPITGLSAGHSPRSP